MCSRFVEQENTEALDLVCKMLDFQPHTRISIETALQHPFLSSLHNPGVLVSESCEVVLVKHAVLK